MLSNTVRSLALLVAIVAAPGVVSQDLSSVPPCAVSCSETAYNAINKACAQTDFACLCKNNEYIRATSSCYKTSCTADQLSKAIEFGTKTCSQVGVNIATNAASNGVTNAANAASNGVANAANATANAASNVAGAAGRVANSTTNSPAASSAPNSSGNPAAVCANTFSIVVLGTAVASLLMV